MIEKQEVEREAREDAKALYRNRNTATEIEFIDLAYAMIMQRFYLGMCAGLDEARSVLKQEPRQGTLGTGA